MLMQHFTYEELKAIKKRVMAQHCTQQPRNCAADVLKGFSLWSRAEELQKAFKYADHEKTDYGEPRKLFLNHSGAEMIFCGKTKIGVLEWRVLWLSLCFF